MSKLIYANLVRLKKDIVFWISILFMLVAGSFVSLKTTPELPLERVFFCYVVVIGLVSSVFCSLYLGTEYGDGTIRNKLIAGHTKTAIYLANLIVCIIAGFIFCFVFLLPMMTIGIARLVFFTISMQVVLLFFITTLAVSAVFSAIYTLISMLCQNKAVAAVSCILCFIVLLCIGASINSKLQQPPIQDNYVMSLNGVEKIEESPNPDYLSGTKREVYQFFLDFLSTGQALQFIELSMVHTWQLPLYSLCIIVLTTCIGIMIFRRKNIR